LLAELSALHADVKVTLTLKEEDGLVGDKVTGQVLSGIDTADDEGAAEVGALEELEKARVFV
jgi:hypothetical protein